MYLFLCLSENNGLAFNHRRQSFDDTVTQDIISTVGAGRLFIKPYSQKLFADKGFTPCVADDIFCAGEKDFVFSELDAPIGCEDDIDKLIIYRWNRDYPADTFFRMDLSPFELVSEIHITGKVHPDITKLVYEKI